jgi:DNA-directed RNA polymerase specialized sigma24 family protein
MSSAGSVTKLIAGLKAGDDVAIAKLLDRFRARVTGLARKRLRGVSLKVEDEDDIAIQALWSLCKGAREGKFSRLADRDDLWGLLVVLTVRKAADRVVFWKTKRRGGGKVRGGSAIHARDASVSHGSIDDAAQEGPGPQTINIMCEEYDRLLERLGDDTLRQIAEWTADRYTIDEIANKLGVSRSTVNRKLKRIKKKLLAAGTP